MQIEYTRLYEQVITIFKKKIEMGEYALNDKLPSERVLIKELGISRGTLRDALRILESQGIIETIPGGGRILRRQIENISSTEKNFLSAYKKSKVFELIEAREIVELGIIDIICKNDTVPQLIALKENLILMSQKKIEYDFHLSLAKITGNTALITFMEFNIDLIDEVREHSFSKKNQSTEVHEEHLEILDDLIKKNCTHAKKSMQLHFENIKYRIEK
ncbi:FadR family transcriptional regulator [Sporosarcina sp. BI001-red]|uniref:FadR/GntR family transcriptional regulator n=1 Tax=Sporosarcina sp. BI001-red TaxID=2282866 RepID=UPI000E25E897|nr:GntR family transcriptional regulator [Sporosarcina sp. BI001-red]REB08752.1 FadR family transcriptional regulator [Sporosarcina sp. BI001-red]